MVASSPTVTLPVHPVQCRAGTDAVSLTAGRRDFHRCSFVHVGQLHPLNSFRRHYDRFTFFVDKVSMRRMTWKTRSNVDSSGFQPSTSDSNSGETRLVRVVKAVGTRLSVRIRELRKNLPLKLLFFLVGFYCATAFATVIGQTGDWDILSAALAVVIVEGIGALMYRASTQLLSNIRSLITLFNYWKAGLSLGLFLDSFKYEIEGITGFGNLFQFAADILSVLS